MDFQIRLKAAAIHLLITVIVTAAVAGFIFIVWFPGDFADMVGGKRLFLLVLACDIALGPLISLVIYNRSKPRAELIRDYAIIAVLQLAMLVYGVSVVVDSRPVYIAFVVDRLEVVTAMELEDADLAQALENRYQKRGWFGPQLISVERPESSGERSSILFSSLEGKDIQLMPQYYRPYASALEQIQARSFPVADLIARKPESKALIERAVHNIGREETVRWLPVRHRFGFWVALIDAESGKPLKYLPIDPY